ncbi:hypothetical protein LCGC14_2304670 [marine sediment metagenome]|uniref:Uncharacterized protein n=1 Tax=marine sediment metagenome TaxID=412755 RepID=A0A0F9CMF2_9ZZZZ|nr:hypothetical protein [bacterium]
MTKEKETREVKGEIEGWSNEPRDFHSNNMGSRGVKIEGDWHNILGKMPDLEKLSEEFKKGTHIKFEEEKNARGYWDVKGDIEKIDSKEAYSKKENPTPNPDKDKNILFQVAFKGAVEAMKIMFKKTEIADLDDLCKWTLNATERMYKGLQKKKLELQENGEW